MICEFLIENGADINYVNEKNGDTLLHVLAQSSSVQELIFQLTNKNIENFNVNAINMNGKYGFF